MKKFLFAVLLIFFYTTTIAYGINGKWDGWNNDYIGTIGDLKIGMTLRFDGNNVSGTYFYNKWLQDIPIKGNIDDKKNIVLNESDLKGNDTGLFKGHFLDHDPEYGKLPLKYEVLEGVWSKPDGSDSKKFRVSLEHAAFYHPGQGRYYDIGVNNDKVVEIYVQKFREAIINKNKKAVAGMIHYPIMVTIMGKKVKMCNSVSLIENYDQIFYPKFYAKIKASVPHNLFVNYSGVMLGNGEIWFALVNNRIRVIAINN